MSEETISLLNYPLVYISDGPFLMGTIPTGLRKTDHEEPQREVTLDAYSIGQHPVTNAQYAQFVEEVEYHQPSRYTEARFNAPDCPVVGISWYDAQAFLSWISERTNQVYRLPTEAEWEKAARGTDGREYPWGNEWDVAKANTSESGLKRPTPIGAYSEGCSPYGCYDMAGNVYDWCSDWFHPQTYHYSPARNPQGPVDGRRKVIRGGAWVARGEFAARCANRAAYEPVQTPHSVGIRIARTRLSDCVP